MNEDTQVLRVLLRRALSTEKLALLPLHFEVGVLDRYRQSPRFSLIRSNTVGRLKKEGDWAIDFGIAPGEEVIHAFAGDLLALPSEDRDHWASCALSLPSSKMMLQMRLAPGSCLDDGEIRPWE